MCCFCYLHLIITDIPESTFPIICKTENSKKLNHPCTAVDERPENPPEISKPQSYEAQPQLNHSHQTFSYIHATHANVKPDFTEIKKLKAIEFHD